ncbi:MAG: GTP 3',8-cyclase MoaA [Bacteroidales bacterium]|nr:GTP 3',8-cyclase MoaA [Bacteroidales bacterium]
MYDLYSRRINYLRISVTDRCNLRCRYCMPEEGVKLISHTEILSFEEITEFVRVAVSMGIDKVRLTGGEPLVRKGITGLVSMISSIEGIRDLSMTTNGILLKKYARELAAAGLRRVNISLDTLDPAKYHYITRGGNLRDVLEGIDAAVDAGLTPVKINCVVKVSSGEQDAVAVERYGREKGLDVRFIRQMDLEGGEFSIVEGGEGGNCAACNRLRLTSNGRVRPCLFNDIEYDVRELGAGKALKLAVDNKPACGSSNITGRFYNIGG